MKKFCLVVLLCFGVYPLLAAPLYRAGDPLPREDDFYRWEVSADGVLSSQQVCDILCQTTLDGAGGFGLRGIYNVRPWLGLGAEGTYFPAQSFGLADKYSVTRAGGMVKFNLSPETSPRAYLLLGAGASRHRFSFRRTPATLHWKKRQTTIAYIQMGIGLETDVWKSVFAGIEGNLLYNRHTSLTPYYRLNKRWDTIIRLRFGARF